MNPGGGLGAFFPCLHSQGLGLFPAFAELRRKELSKLHKSPTPLRKASTFSLNLPTDSGHGRDISKYSCRVHIRIFKICHQRFKFFQCRPDILGTPTPRPDSPTQKSFRRLHPARPSFLHGLPRRHPQAHRWDLRTAETDPRANGPLDPRPPLFWPCETAPTPRRQGREQTKSWKWLFGFRASVSGSSRAPRCVNTSSLS